MRPEVSTMNELKPKHQLNIKSERAYKAALELSRLTGESLTSTVISALEEKLDRRHQAKIPDPETRTREERIAALLDLGRRFSELAPGDTRTPDEIIGYDENGLPT
jgi:antitoxin VapB